MREKEEVEGKVKNEMRKRKDNERKEQENN